MPVPDPTAYDTIVVDAEPLVAYFLDGTGADIVETFLEAVEGGRIDGVVNAVSKAETYYVCARSSDHTTAERYLDTLSDNGFTTADARSVWSPAGALKADHAIAIGDAFTLATARSLADGGEHVLLLVGGDGDFEPFVGRTGEGRPDVVRFRDGTD